MIRFFSESKTYSATCEDLWLLRELNALQIEKKKHMQIEKTTSSIWQHTRCKCSQHNQIKTLKSLFVCVVSICSTCCETDEGVFFHR